MMSYVNRPEVRRIVYVMPSEEENLIVSSRTLRRLRSLACEHGEGLQLNNAGITIHPKKKMQTVQGHIKDFCNKANNIYHELGGWAADYFIQQTIEILLSNVDTAILSFEKNTIRSILSPLATEMAPAEHNSHQDWRLSSKAESLIRFLSEESMDDLSGLVFVQQRATTAVLCHLISVHPKTREAYRCASFVGTSNSGARRYGLAEIFNLKAQQNTLAYFRAGTKNLIVATSVLEEGIDVQACNLVVCYDPPANMKSFIQRRGRARQKRSVFAVMTPLNHEGPRVDEWQKLEQDLINLYQDDQRTLQSVLALESVEETMNYRIEVESTGALLTAASTMAHLHHFCALLPRQPYCDKRPIFSFEENSQGLLATVVLPNCIASSMRTTKALKEWKSERSAAKDAAFQAYASLYRGGLINSNLLPLSHSWDIVENDVMDVMDSTVTVPCQFNVWKEMALASSPTSRYQSVVTLQALNNETKDLRIILTTPAPLESMPVFRLYWKPHEEFQVHVGSSKVVECMDPFTLSLYNDTTQLLLRSGQSSQKPTTSTDFIVQFTPDIVNDDLQSWLTAHQTTQNGLAAYKNFASPPRIVRPAAEYGKPFVFMNWSSQEHQGVSLKCVSLPKRRNFLLANVQTADGGLLRNAKKPLFVDALTCEFDALPFVYCQFGLYIPSILRSIEAFSLATRLQATLLRPVGLKSLPDLVTALSAPSAQWISNYQRFEFLGDAFLKFVVSTHLYLSHPNWPEGYLTVCTTQLVSNIFLARTALKMGLDRYIMTEAPQTKHWTAPVYSSDDSQQPERTLSTKLLADVVEALIGVAWMDSGLSSVRKCIEVFLTDISSAPWDFAHSRPQHQSNFALQAEQIIGRQFHSKSLLLEALTHPSCGSDSSTESYQRLEFLGDAVLDILVVRHLSTRISDLSQGRMTQIKAAFVNAMILGFIGLEFKVTEEGTDVEQTGHSTFRIQPSHRNLQLWQCMRHQSLEITEAQRECLERFKLQRNVILHRLEHGESYPWAELATLRPDKYYSDLIESIIGAIFVDSGGDLLPCQDFIERIGLFRHLRRAASTTFDVRHPRDTLHRMTASQTVTFNYKWTDDGLYDCQVLIDTEQICEVAGCSTKDEAMVVAASAAVQALTNVASSHRA
ncbi:putative RNA helicase/RNAse III [Acrodontium crateriforme]|uniref:RNA helicase/RNAse III n=1 Tax=Acrodontium crateriforme TaxID=150365 RepID=A0AAQ3M6W7_9PEZI|nr:putative RNA helicase/RNAse III [Acrodontium crateriforme]